MNELLVPLRWDALNSLTFFIDTGLTSQKVETPGRLRLVVITEELFGAAMASLGSGAGQLHCQLQPGRIIITCSAAWDIPPERSYIYRLCSDSGAQLCVEGRSCTIRVK